MSMNGFFASAITGLFPKASELKEDWTEKTVKFNADENFTGSCTLDMEAIENLADLLDVYAVDIQVTAKPDSRYQSEGGPGVIIEISVSDVTFPERP